MLNNYPVITILYNRTEIERFENVINTTDLRTELENSLKILFNALFLYF